MTPRHTANDRPIEDTGPLLDVIAEFEAWPSGIAVSPAGRLFVSFPCADQPIDAPTLTEIRDGRAVAFPDTHANNPHATGPTRPFTSIHALRMGPAS